MLSDEEQRAVYDKCRDYMVSALSEGAEGRGLKGLAKPCLRRPAAGMHAIAQRRHSLGAAAYLHSAMSDRLCHGHLHALPVAQEANPGRGLPVLSAEEAALMRSGIAELARLRRMGAKAAKHPPMEREVSL